MRSMLLVENLRAAISDKNLSKFLKVQKSLVDVDLKLMGMMKIPKLLDKSKLSENYSNLLDDLAILCEKSV